MVADAVVAASMKGGIAWLTSIFKDWSKARKACADDEKAWDRMALAVVKQTKLVAARYSKITTVAFPRDAVPLDQIYIPLTLESEKNGEKHVVEKFPQKLFNKHKKIIVVDIAGMGKSTISRIIFIRSLEQNVHLPFLIDLRRLDGSSDVEELLASQFCIKKSQKDHFNELLHSKPVLVIFDGFDEVQDKKKTHVARRIRDFVDRCSEAKFLITSRPGLVFSEYTDFSTFGIKGLTNQEAHLLISKYGMAFGIADRAKALLDELKARHDGPVQSFLENPLLASLLFRAFEYKSVVPVKRGVFYRQVFDALFEAHDLNKETGYVREKKTALHHDEFHRVLRAMAKLFRQHSVTEVDTSQFHSMAKEISKSLCPDLIFESADLLEDVIHAVPLFSRDGNFIRWAHKSLLDYFLCEFLIKDYAEAKSDALRRSAFGPNASQNENFLTLVHEADPILFADSVTITAIDKVLLRRNTIESKIPRNVDVELSKHYVAFFSSYDIIISKDIRSLRQWADFENQEKETILAMGLADFRPHLAFKFDKHFFLVFASDAVVALHVPMTIKAISHVSSFEIARHYPSTGKASLDDFQGELEVAVNSSAKTKIDWEVTMEDFMLLMHLLRGVQLMIPDLSRMDQERGELAKMVERSLGARSDDVF